MRSNETHDTKITIDPRLEQEYIKTHLTPSEEAWPYNEPFPMDIELAKYNKDYPVSK
jgi:hypothetical protein